MGEVEEQVEDDEEDEDDETTEHPEEVEIERLAEEDLWTKGMDEWAAASGSEQPSLHIVLLVLALLCAAYKKGSNFG